MSTFKRIFLTLTLTLFGAMALPAMAAECQMQPDGNMVCDGQVFAPVPAPIPAPTPSVAKDSAHPSTQDSTANPTSQNPVHNFSREEKEVMDELLEKNISRRYLILGVSGVLAFVFAISSVFVSKNASRIPETFTSAKLASVGLLALCLLFSIVCSITFMT